MPDHQTEPEEGEATGAGGRALTVFTAPGTPQVVHRYDREPVSPELEAAEIEELRPHLDKEEGPPALVRLTPDGARHRPRLDADTPAETIHPDERLVMLTGAHLNRPARQDPAAPELTGDQRARVETAAAAARSPSTVAAYTVQWNQFAAWADTHKLQELPAHPATVAAYLADRADHGASVSTLRVASAAISAAHRDRGHTDPTKHEGVKRTIAGVSRQQAGRQKRQARALTDQALAAIRATAHQPRLWADGKRQESPGQAQRRGDLDIALCAVLRDGLLRRSEAAALTWRDVETTEDGSGRLTVKHSKTDQEGQGAVLYLAPQTMQDLDRIRPAQPDPAKRVFGLGPARLGGRVREAAQAAGLPDADLFTGHSGRVGMAQDLVKDGATLPELMQAGRWQSPEMPAHYARAELAAHNAVARYHQRHNPASPASAPAEDVPVPQNAV